MKRFCIVLLWVALIGSILYFPRLRIFHLEEKRLNVFAWGDILDPSVVADFERDTGIKINLSYYSSNEELVVKMRATQGEGYDLIIPSDFAVSRLVQEGLLKPIDQSKLPFWEELNPLLLNHRFDPGNRYSIPFEWELFGLGINSQYFKEQGFEPSWKLIFQENGYKISMLNEAMQAMLIAELYLYQKVAPLQREEFGAIKETLFTQKPFVEAYTDFRADYFLATGNCPVVVASSSYIWRTRKLFPFAEFILPKEGTLISIENLCIPAKSDKEELAYQFINALFSRSSLTRHFQTFGNFPARQVKLEMDPTMERLFQPTQSQFEQYYFYETIAPQQQVRDLWVELKSN
jgi:spermidine/putrescine transport system substrate-binding protein